MTRGAIAGTGPVAAGGFCRFVNRQHDVRLAGDVGEVHGVGMGQRVIEGQPQAAAGPDQRFGIERVAVDDVRGQQDRRIETPGDEVFLDR